MNEKTMNRRTLCKAVVAMGWLAAAFPLKQLAAAEAPEAEKPSELPAPLHQGIKPSHDSSSVPASLDFRTAA